jgi:hypothetical protein
MSCWDAGFQVQGTDEGLLADLSVGYRHQEWGNTDMESNG